MPEFPKRHNKTVDRNRPQVGCLIFGVAGALFCRLRFFIGRSVTLDVVPWKCSIAELREIGADAFDSGAALEIALVVPARSNQVIEHFLVGQDCDGAFVFESH